MVKKNISYSLKYYELTPQEIKIANKIFETDKVMANIIKKAYWIGFLKYSKMMKTINIKNLNDFQNNEIDFFSMSVKEFNQLKTKM